MKLEGKICVVTGASMGIGEAVASLFVREGAKVVLASRDLGRVEAARARIGSPERTSAFACDVRDAEQTRALLAAALKLHGRVEVWVNNAGFGMVDSVERMDMEACRQMFDTNLFGVISAMQAVIPQMKQQGSGTIINVSSLAGWIPVAYMSAYGATKHALNCITKAARLEVRRHGVNVVLVSPGYVSTEFAAHAVRGREDSSVPASIKFGISPERVAQAVLKACSGNRREIVVPWYGSVWIALYRLAPSLFEWGMMKAMRRK